MASTEKNERDPRADGDERSVSPGRCPMCEKSLPPRDGNQAHPFCSARCQLADLGRWLDEDYRF